MTEENGCIGGDGGPLIILQAAAVPQWEGASNFDNSLMNCGNVETDYDVICNNLFAGEVAIMSRYDREMLILWDCEFGARRFELSLPSYSVEALVIGMCCPDDELENAFESIAERVRQGSPEHSFHMNVQDATLRLQVGADSPQPFYSCSYLDMPVAAGINRCDVYYLKSETGEIVVVIDAL